MEYLYFITLYLIICNWFQIRTFIQALSKPKENIYSVTDKWITDIVLKKTGIPLQKITIFESKKPFGMMPGTPLNPEMILSSTLYQTFTRAELEWVILHEAAHCKLWHVLQLNLLQLIILSSGIILNYYLNNIFISIFLPIIFSLIFILCARYFEYEADIFSISNVDDPRGVITAQEKMKSYWNNKSENNIIRKYLHWNILPSQRIALAKKRLTE